MITSHRLVRTDQDSTERRSSFKGMATRISSNNFVLNLGAMYDSLEELASLSKDLQERNIMLPRAHNLVQRQIQVFTSMVDHPAVYYKEAEAAVLVEKKFKGVPLNSRKCDVVIHHGQFMRSLATNLEKRLMAFKSKDGNTEKLLNAINVLDPLKWASTSSCPLTYGQKEVVFLSNLFCIDDTEARRGLKEYIDIVQQEGIDQEPPATLAPLRNAVKTIGSLFC